MTSTTETGGTYAAFLSPFNDSSFSQGRVGAHDHGGLDPTLHDSAVDVPERSVMPGIYLYAILGPMVRLSRTESHYNLMCEADIGTRSICTSTTDSHTKSSCGASSATSSSSTSSYACSYTQIPTKLRRQLYYISAHLSKSLSRCYAAWPSRAQCSPALAHYTLYYPTVTGPATRARTSTYPTLPTVSACSWKRLARTAWCGTTSGSQSGRLSPPQSTRRTPYTRSSSVRWSSAGSGSVVKRMHRRPGSPRRWGTWAICLTRSKAARTIPSATPSR